ncbi:hypothetical protein [Sphingobacterium sp. UME9]|uniref:hypothetical protein n=1 Tax=Sphingobacterium sp. UME9 TaxID=1862316 RepID=UPI001601AF5D|nr:hypothetical protein [Sphingobacterium sp. UME9]
MKKCFVEFNNSKNDGSKNSSSSNNSSSSQEKPKIDFGAVYIEKSENTGGKFKK